ncbi:hypothetical protein VZT92_013622 [Zoarces viviparus]|uniref:Uncharacterized protein n=1 Tax=Zoarces viviparus TaxID=48416 RepID=A0AAW1F3Z5_ZOAVI
MCFIASKEYCSEPFRFLSRPSKRGGYLQKSALENPSPSDQSRGAPVLHNAERSKSTAIIIRAVLLWTLMAVPVPAASAHSEGSSETRVGGGV